MKARLCTKYVTGWLVEYRFLCPLDRARLCDGSAFLGWLTCGHGSGCEHRTQRRPESIFVRVVATWEVL
jgi:hypothetical protein